MEVGEARESRTDAQGDLLERAAELGVLESAFARAATGAGAVVHVTGAAGIGKSALLDASRAFIQVDNP